MDTMIFMVDCRKRDAFYASYIYLKNMRLRLRCIRLSPTDNILARCSFNTSILKHPLHSALVCTPSRSIDGIGHLQLQLDVGRQRIQEALVLQGWRSLTVSVQATQAQGRLREKNDPGAWNI
jgi:hypothetical protein